jgi:hypothetical protein
MADVSFGQTFSQITSNAIKPAFELRFSQMQNTLIDRLNVEISKLNDDRAGDNKIERLKAEGEKLRQALPVVQDFLVNTRSSQEAIKGVSDSLSTLNDLLGADDLVVQDEVDAFVAQRDAIADRIDRIFIFSNAEIPNFNAVKQLKEQLTSFKDLTPVVGTKNQNLSVTDGVADLRTRSFNAEALVAITVEQAHDVSLNIQSNFIDTDADLIQLESVSFAKKQAQIDDLRAQTANLLQIFSLAFEGQAFFAENLAKSLRPQTNDPGSILNIFT